MSVLLRCTTAIAFGLILLSACADRRLPKPETAWQLPAERFAFFLPPSEGICSEWTHSPRYEYQDTTFFDHNTRMVILRGRFGVAATPQGECRGRVRTTVVNGFSRRDRIRG